MNINRHITRSALELYLTLKKMTDVGLIVAEATIGARNPHILLAEPPRSGQIRGHVMISRFDGDRTIRRQVAIVDGCQIEWEE